MKLRIFALMFLLSTLFIPTLFVQAAPTTGGSTVTLINPIGGSAKDGGNKAGETNIKAIVANAIIIILGILGSITLGVFVYGGFMWLTSAGNSDQVRKGSETILYATIGLFIIFGAYAILNTILKGLAR